MTPRQKRRLLAVGMTAAGLTLAATLTLTAFQQNLLFFLTPTQIHQSQAHPGQTFRLGGIVAPASLHRDGLTTHFQITDLTHTIAIEYTGILPDLFRENQGVVILGRLSDTGDRVIADEVLAKHDENYMPPEVKETLDKAAIERTLQQ